MTRSRLTARVDALESSHDMQAIGNGGIIVVWGESDPEREAKGMQARRMKETTLIYLDENDISAL